MARFMAKHNGFLGISGTVGWALASPFDPDCGNKHTVCVRYTAVAKCWPAPCCRPLNPIKHSGDCTGCTAFLYIQELFTCPSVCCCTFHTIFSVRFFRLKILYLLLVSPLQTTECHWESLHSLTDWFYNRDGVCLLRGTDFIYRQV
jgi:hypothetical protein